MRCRSAGGKGKRTVSKCACAMTASRKGVRHALLARLARSCEREHRLDQRLKPKRRTHLAAEHELLLAGVPPLVRLPRLHDEHIACVRGDFLACDPRAERARHDLKGLDLCRVDVRSGDERLRLCS